MEVISLYGITYVNPGTRNEFILPPGFTLLIDYDAEPTDAVIEAGGIDRTNPTSFGGLRVITYPQIDGLKVLEPLPLDILNYEAPPPIIVTPSGVGGPIIKLIFKDPEAIEGIPELCAQGMLPVSVCQIYGFPTP